jgi:hypothetical protein
MELNYAIYLLSQFVAQVANLQSSCLFFLGAGITNTTPHSSEF